MDNTPITIPLRTVKSYVKRESRKKLSTQAIINEFWTQHGINLPSSNEFLNLEKLFGNNNPCTLEIGFGKGTSLIQMALNTLDINFIGVEVYTAGIAQVLREIEAHKLKNIKLVNFDAVEFIECAIAHQSLNKVQIFFPDPWPKKKHFKRRIIQDKFIDMLTQKLIPGGILHFATDWRPYAEHALEVLNNSPSLVNLSVNHTYYTEKTDRTETHFERRGKNLGFAIWELIFKQLTP